MYAPVVPAIPFTTTFELYSLPFCVVENLKGCPELLESLKSNLYLLPIVTFKVASFVPSRKYTLEPKPLFATVTPIFIVVCGTVVEVVVVVCGTVVVVVV